MPVPGTGAREAPIPVGQAFRGRGNSSRESVVINKHRVVRGLDAGSRILDAPVLFRQAGLPVVRVGRLIPNESRRPHEIGIVDGLVDPAGCGVEERRDAILRRQHARAVGLHVAILIIDADGRLRRAVPTLEQLWVPPQRPKDALVVIERGLLAVFGVIVQRGHADGQLVRQQHSVDIERIAQGAVAADAILKLALILVFRRIDAGIDDARRAANAEQDRVGTALQVNAADVVTIPRYVGQEIVAGVVGGIETAHAGVGVGLDKVAAFAGAVDVRAANAGIVAIDAADLGVGRVLQQRLIVGRADVAEKISRDDADRGRDILEVGLDARPGQGRLGPVAGALRGFDHERGQFHDLFGRLAGDSSDWRRGSGWRRRGSGLAERSRNNREGEHGGDARTRRE